MSMEASFDYCLGVLAAHPDQQLVQYLMALGETFDFKVKLYLPTHFDLSLIGLGGGDASDTGADGSPTIDLRAERPSDGGASPTVDWGAERPSDGGASPTIDWGAERPSDGGDKEYVPCSLAPAPEAAAPDDGMDQTAWRGRKPLVIGIRAQNATERSKPTRPKEVNTAIKRKMSLAVLKQQGGQCKLCRRTLEINDGRIEGGDLDHVNQLALEGICPLYAAANDEARRAVALDDTIFQVLCEKCHAAKTEADARKVAAAAASTVFWDLFRLGARPEWTVGLLETRFPGDEMQRVLEDRFNADLIAAGASLNIYKIGRGGRPMFSCQDCGELTEVTKYSWSQDNRDALARRRVYAMMLKPRCHDCRSYSTVPVVCEPTPRPQYTKDSAATRMTDLRNSEVKWLMPRDEAELKDWREKMERGEVWFK
jgi:5-methylcytosine-specific restriction endonuclease McrA